LFIEICRKHFETNSQMPFKVGFLEKTWFTTPDTN